MQRREMIQNMILAGLAAAVPALNLPRWAVPLFVLAIDANNKKDHYHHSVLASRESDGNIHVHAHWHRALSQHEIDYLEKNLPGELKVIRDV